MTSHEAYTNAAAGGAGLMSYIIGDAMPDLHHIALALACGLVVKVSGMALDAMWARIPSRWSRNPSKPPPAPKA